MKQIIIHEEYDPINVKNDIAILELPEEVDLTEYTPACMAKADDMTYADKKAWAYGEIIIILRASHIRPIEIDNLANSTRQGWLSECERTPNPRTIIHIFPNFLPLVYQSLAIQLQQ